MVSATQVASTAATAASAAVPPARRIFSPASAVAGWFAAIPAATREGRGEFSTRRSVCPAAQGWLPSASMTVTGPPHGVRLPRRVVTGYSLGSLVTGPLGTVPGLLLLPYLTDTLGVAA